MDAKSLQPGNGYQLPPEAYYDQQWFDREQQDLFPSVWNFACTTDALSAPGCYVSLEIGHYPIVLVHQEDGSIRGFHNLCRHRGARILDGSGTCKSLVCPYHRWQYDLDGTLKNVPQQEDQIPLIDKTDWGLKSVAVATWMGMVFVNPDGTAEPLESWLDQVPDHLSEFKVDELTELAHEEYEFNANWKIYVENHIDWYHLWYVHFRTLRNLDHHSGEIDLLGPHFVSFEPAKSPEVDQEPFKPLDWLTPGAKRTGAHLLFPNLTLFTGASWVGIGLITPISPTRTRMSLRLRALPDQDPAEFLKHFHQITQVEDAAVAARVQSAVRSPAFSVGPLTKDFEKPITRFHDAYLQAISS